MRNEKQTEWKLYRNELSCEVKLHVAVLGVADIACPHNSPSNFSTISSPMGGCTEVYLRHAYTQSNTLLFSPILYLFYSAEH